MAGVRLMVKFSSVVRATAGTAAVLLLSLSCGGDDGPSGPGGGQPATLVKVSADPQTATAGSPVPTSPAVRVDDSNGDPVAGATVTFTVTSGGGTTTGASQTTNALGIAQVGSWTLGLTPGTNTLQASVGTLNTTFTATGTQIVPTSAVVGPGDLQRAQVGTAVSVPPAVYVTGAGGQPVPGLGVTFAVTGGGGSITGGSATTDQDGLAAVGSWTLGASAGINALTATVSGFSDVVFEATASIDVPRWNFEVRFVGSTLTPEIQALVDGAIARWEEVIVGDLPDIDFTTNPFPVGSCPISGNPEINEVVDDMILFAEIKAIDGPGGTLASATPCRRREWGGLPYFGVFQFDTDDLPGLSPDDASAVFLHEIGHTLGFTVWDWAPLGLVEDANCLTNPPANFSDVHFTGPRALAAFDANGGANYNEGQKVPLHTGGATVSCGSKDSHWRESVFDTELMSPSIDIGSGNPLSIVTIEALGDMGYGVDPAAADPYNIVLAAPAAALSGRKLDLGSNHVLEWSAPLTTSRGLTSTRIIR